MATTPAVLPPVREGEILAGKYRVERVLGVGGMGVVVAARHVELENLVAIKFVRDDVLGNREAVERFVREARAAARLRSDHAARVLDVGKLESGAPYMVMEFLDGSDLGQVLLEYGPMAADVAVRLILQACEAVAEAHAAGIVHRDIKPQNLFLARTVGGSPKLKVLDFGVSKAAGFVTGAPALTRTSAMLGSPLYMAPEQMRSSRNVDGRADIWALGVVLFELLTGRWPFEADTMPELCLKVVGDPPQSLAALRPDLPAALVATVERCLQKSPDARFADVAELTAALEPFSPASGLPPQAARPSQGPAAVSAAPVAGATLPSALAEPTAAPVEAPAQGSTPFKDGSGPTRGRPSPAWAIVGGAAIVILLAASFTLRWRRADSGAGRPSAAVASATSAAVVRPGRDRAPGASLSSPSTTPSAALEQANQYPLAAASAPSEAASPVESARSMDASAASSRAVGSAFGTAGPVAVGAPSRAAIVAPRAAPEPAPPAGAPVQSRIPTPKTPSKSGIADDDIPSYR